MAIKVEMRTCKLLGCGKQYDQVQLVRSMGTDFAMKGFCSAQCYTKHATGEKDPVEGKRIELIQMQDEHTDLKRGDRGVGQFTDGAGQIHVKWDNGSTLALIPGVDQWKVLKPKEISNQDLIRYGLSMLLSNSETACEDLAVDEKELERLEAQIQSLIGKRFIEAPPLTDYRKIYKYTWQELATIISKYEGITGQHDASAKADSDGVEIKIE